MKAMKVLICDDDKAYANKCKTHLIALAAKHNIELEIEIVESGDKLVFFMDTKYARADLIYMDYNMPGLNGVQTARLLRENGFVADIVFNTKDESHALEGYDVNALDYLIKGKFDKEKFENVFLKAVHRLRRRNSEIMTFTHRGEQRNIRIDDILYFEVQQQKVIVHYLKGDKTEKFEFYSTLTQISNQLSDNGFYRSHRSYLVALKYIYRKTSSQIEMINGEIIPIGREYRFKGHI
jgi:DNA-binding LytR/AlgR family response regulator